MTQAILHSAHIVRSINTTRAEHQHHMCGVTKHSHFTAFSAITFPPLDMRNTLHR